ncbi:amino acid adenylation domain-containing protein, partial [Amycolatopsis sp. NPDC000740]
PLELPTDRSRPAARSTAGAVREFGVPSDVARRLAELARTSETTLFTVLFAACQALFARYTGQEDIALGTVVSGRDRPELERVVGFFVNTVVLRSEVDRSASFADHLAAARQTVLDAFAHDDVPFEEVVDAVHAGRDPGRNPLFDVMVLLHNAGAGPAFPGLSAELAGVTRDSANFDLTVEFEESDGRLAGLVEYSTELFEVGTIDRLIAHLLRLLAGVSADPGRRIADLPLTTETEEAQLLGWRGPVIDVPNGTIVDLLDHQARTQPTATALVCGDVRLSFAELAARTDVLAADLAGRGAGPDRVVAVLLPRSADAIIALFAVLKAGAVHQSIDPGLPAERIEVLLADTRPVVVLDRIGGFTDGPRPAAPQPSDAAYVIHTSGSTGTPKGVVVEHAALVNLLVNHRAAFGRERLRVALTASLSFDTSWEGPLLLADGHELHLISDETRLDPAALTRYVRDERIGFLDVTPSYLRQLLPAGLLAGEQRPRFLMVGGEAIGESLWHELAGSGVAAGNYYGPTESTVDATWARVTGGRPSIGRPLGNVGAYVLDDQLRLVPAGVPGELCLAGAQLARGYLGRPGLTADRFVANPFGAPGTRLYRTGDRARWTADGRLEHLGRTDDQIKVRGFRIEPGEVETALRAQPGVIDAAVDARDGRLVAYIVGEPADLRSELTAVLPAHLIPSVFVRLDQLPLTRHGKLDRLALPEPEISASAQYVAPRDEREQLVTDVWAEVLGLERVGVEDDFFALGGDSLLGIRVVARLRAELGADVPARLVFTAPTPALLAAQLPAASAPQEAIPLLPRGDGPFEAPLSFAQQRLWFLDEFDPGSTEYVSPTALRLRGDLDVPALNQALTALVARHESLRTTFATVDGRGVQIVHPPHAVDLQAADGDLETALAGATGPVDLHTGPLLRAALTRLGPGDHVLTLVLHHIVTDGWSSGVLLSELATLYSAFTRDEEPGLPPLPVHYADYAVWQRNRTDFDSQLSYWRHRLAGLEPLELPTDRPRPAVRTKNGALHEFSVPVGTTARLAELSRQQGSTLFMTLLAACQLLFARWSGQDDVAVGTVVSGRERTELEGLIGFFANTLVLRSTVDLTRGFAEFLGEVRDTVLDAFAHQDVPFDRVVDDVQPERDPSRTPLCQVMVVLHNTPDARPALPGLAVEEVAPPIVTAGFDLAIHFQQTAGRLDAVVNYNTDLFDAATIERLSNWLRILLAGIAATPQQALGRLPWITADERDRVLRGWNPTAVAAPEPTLHRLFAAQAA